MITARLDRNKYQNEFSIDGRPFSGVDDARIEYIGKRQVLVLVISDFKLLPATKCPERRRFHRVLKALGDADAVAALQPSCNMIRMNPEACNGCPDYPL